MAMIDETVRQEQYLVDQLTTWQQLRYTLSHPLAKGWIYVVLPVLFVVFPVSLVAALVTFPMLWISRQKWSFPARVPREAGRIDRNDVGPGGKGFRRGRGEAYLGNHRKTGKEVWGSFDDFLTHLYMLAATGGGKSQAIWSILINFLGAGSGFSLTDGKGTIEMTQDGRVVARRFGMEDQYMVVNYMSGDVRKPQKRMSNSINTFTHGNAAQIKEKLASLALSGDAGQNQFFEDNAEVILERAMPAIVELRDKGLLSLNIAAVGRYLQLDGLYELYCHEDISDLNRRYVKDQLINVGYDLTKAKAGKAQSPEVIKQYGQFVSHFAKVISSLSIQYRSIFVTDQSDINMRDVLSNRRLMMSNLPSLEKSGAELKNLGNIVLSEQKMGVAADLGDQLEGTVEETRLRLSKNWQVPYALTYDEWAAYSITDIFLIPAQVRGIKYSSMFFAQDYAGTEGAGEKDAEQVFANTRFKFFGALEEAGKSWTRIRDLIGESLIAVNSGYRYIPGVLKGRYVRDQDKTEITRRSQIEIKDLQEQVDGQMFMFLRGRLSPISFYFADIDSMLKGAAPGHGFRINRFLRVYPPLPEEMVKIEREERFVHLLHKPDTLFLEQGIIRPISKSLSRAATNRDVLETQDYLRAMTGFIEENAMALNLTINRHRPVQRQVEPAPLPPETPNEAQEAGDSPSTETSTTANTDETQTSPTGDLGDLSAFDVPNAPEPPPEPQKPLDVPESAIEEQAPPPAASEPAPAATQRDTEADLATQTRRAKEVIKTAEHPPAGAHILSEKEASDLKGDMQDICRMIGYPSELGSNVAQKTIDSLERHCYYLAPPKPRLLDSSRVSEFDARVERLLNHNEVVDSTP